MYRVWNALEEYSWLLIIGATTALIWANVSPGTYFDMVEFVLIDDFLIGRPYQDASGDIHRTLTLEFLVNDVLMALFFAVAAKEVWEAIILREGSLRGTKAATPLIATLGGIVGPVGVYLALAVALGSDAYSALSQGWAIPTATDIALAYVVGRLVFGAGHPAIRFLLLLAIADDAAGMVILAVFYPTADLALHWLGLSLGAALAVFALFNWLPRWLDRGDQLRRRSTWTRQKLGGWPYAVAGCLSWYGFQQAGIPAALGLLPIVPTIPHADRAFGIFAEAETLLHDLLNRLEHLLRHPVAVTLFLFGLVNAGAELTSVGAPTWLVLGGLGLGKPLGIIVFGLLAAKGMRLGLPNGMRTADLIVVSFIAAIGFTMSIYLATVAFNTGIHIEGINIRDAAKLGALASLGASGIAIIAGKLLRVQKL